MLIPIFYLILISFFFAYTSMTNCPMVCVPHRSSLFVRAYPILNIKPHTQLDDSDIVDPIFDRSPIGMDNWNAPV